MQCFSWMRSCAMTTLGVARGDQHDARQAFQGNSWNIFGCYRYCSADRRHFLRRANRSRIARITVRGIRESGDVALTLLVMCALRA